MSRVGLPSRTARTKARGMSATHGAKCVTRQQRCVRALAIAAAVLAIVPGFASAGQADDSPLQLVGLDIGATAVENQALSKVRGQGLEAPMPVGPGEQDFAVILWDERGVGSVDGQASSGVGPVNSSSPGSTTSVTVSN